jgi:hypothetical protein
METIYNFRSKKKFDQIFLAVLLSFELAHSMHYNLEQKCEFNMKNLKLYIRKEVDYISILPEEQEVFPFE